LKSAVLTFSHEHTASLDSTNAELLRRATRGDSIHLRSLSADAQTAGRGQRGRAWHAAPGNALLLSVGWHFEKSQSLSGLSLAVGVCVAECLSELIGRSDSIALKWPNDLLLNRTKYGATPGKLGGILIETVGVEATARAAVMGIGINLALPDVSLDSSAANAFSALAPAALHEVAAISRTTLLDALLPALVSTLARFSRDGFVPFKETWWSRRAYANDHGNETGAVIVRTPGGESLVGHMIEINDNGALIIETNSGRHTLVSGQVSLRRNDDARS
jgi:BirA family transcriptional regulator, biotin operon repressor / biotin---[acetyl-CoA-carboxylase] ligase